jgi:hypothetical protein
MTRLDSTTSTDGSGRGISETYRLSDRDGSVHAVVNVKIIPNPPLVGWTHPSPIPVPPPIPPIP